MDSYTLSVREIQEPDIIRIVNYWMAASPAYLLSMGADPDKVPSREQFTAMLSEQLSLPYPEKKSYCIIWEADGSAIGHCNVNKINFGESAYMHLHLWDGSTRQQGRGVALVKMALPYFFNNLQLKRLYCEPYALNPAPNKTLAKVGFTLIREYVTTPGAINFEQPVKLWELTQLPV
ncbi:MAG: GNAT family N-acetyltransferase [Saprospiraceae bacterium]|nr:GNAT family N-acetyltransferase [Saprospiraceae bacterium]